MAEFTSLIGKRVEVNYRAGDIRMTATGTLAIDSGEFIRIEDRLSQSGREKTVRLEIPYPSLVRVRQIFAETEPHRAS
jgi:hypothetical protein